MPPSNNVAKEWLSAEAVKHFLLTLSASPQSLMYISTICLDAQGRTLISALAGSRIKLLRSIFRHTERGSMD